MKLFISAFLTSVAVAQGRNLQTSGTTTDLETKWAIDENPSSVYTASSNMFVMTYASVADTLTVDDNMQVTFYDKNCKNPVAIEGSSTPTMYSLTEGMGIKKVDATDTDQDALPTPLKLGNNEGAKIEFELDPETLANDSKIYSILENGNGAMELCFRFGLGYWEQGSEDTNQNVFQEVNFVESVISITYDLTAGFAVANFGVAPKEQDVATGTLTYEVTAYLCEPGSEGDGAAYPAVSTATTTFNQGAMVEVCVRPDDDTRGDGVVMDALTNFEWKRDDISQEAIVDSEVAANGLTTYSCDTQSEYCHFSSILFADFYKTSGSVVGSGKANLKFLLATEAPSELASAAPSKSTAPSESPADACACTDNGDGNYIKVYSSPNDWDFRHQVNNFINGDTGVRAKYGNNLNCWDVSDVTNMFGAFFSQSNFNERLDCWNTSKVTNMMQMFKSAPNFNQDISAWDTSSVTEMRNMFQYASVFNQDLCDWNINNAIGNDWVTNMFENTGCPNAANPTVTGSYVCHTCTSSRRLENNMNQENDHNNSNSNKNNRNNEIVAERTLQEDDNDTADAAAGPNLKGDDEGRRNLQDDAIITTTAANTATVASSPFDVSVGVTKADDGPGALKTAGGDASSVVGFTALASVVALTGAAALLA